MTERRDTAILAAVTRAARKWGKYPWTTASDVAAELELSTERTRAHLRRLAVAGQLEADPPPNFRSTGAAERYYKVRGAKG